MQGNILSFTVQQGQGLISGDDGQRYTFTGAEWRENAPPHPGERVDFQPEGTQALAVYRVMGSGVGVSRARKNKVAAGLLRHLPRIAGNPQVLPRLHDAGRNSALVRHLGLVPGLTRLCCRTDRPDRRESSISPRPTRTSTRPTKWAKDSGSSASLPPESILGWGGDAVRPR